MPVIDGIEERAELERDQIEQAGVAAALLGRAEIEPQIARREAERQVFGPRLLPRLERQVEPDIDAEVAEFELLEREDVEHLEFIEIDAAPYAEMRGDVRRGGAAIGGDRRLVVERELELGQRDRLEIFIVGLAVFVGEIIDERALCDERIEGPRPNCCRRRTYCSPGTSP